MKTVIGDHNLFYVGAHVAHDCVVGSHVILANHVGVGGHVEIGDYAYLGGYSAIHQFVRIGSHAIIGGGTAITADVIPFGRASGPRGGLCMGLNIVGLSRKGAAADQLKIIKNGLCPYFQRGGAIQREGTSHKNRIWHA